MHVLCHSPRMSSNPCTAAAIVLDVSLAGAATVDCIQRAGADQQGVRAHCQRDQARRVVTVSTSPAARVRTECCCTMLGLLYGWVTVDQCACSFSGWCSTDVSLARPRNLNSSLAPMRRVARGARAALLLEEGSAERNDHEDAQSHRSSGHRRAVMLCHNFVNAMSQSESDLYNGQWSGSARHYTTR